MILERTERSPRDDIVVEHYAEKELANRSIVAIALQAAGRRTL
jgi:hypothetical protein